MSGQGRDITESRSIVPSSPFEIQATQDLLQKRIENGMSLPPFSLWFRADEQAKSHKEMSI